MGRPVPPQFRAWTAPYRLLWPVTAAVAGAALVASTVQTAPHTRLEPDVAPVAAVSCAAGVWKADYYANTTLTGTPRKSLCDTSVNESWGRGHPAGISLPNDRFGVRWTMRRDFGGGGPFLLKTAAQDGVRVWIDGRNYVNLWHDYSSTRQASVKVTVPAGTHSVRVDYVAFTGSANVAVSLAPTTPDRTAPLAPGSVKAVSGDRRATVSWARNAEADLAGYRVYRSTSSPVAIDTAHRISGSALLTGHSLTSTGLRNGTKYWFAVTAVDRSGNQSRASANVSAVPADTTPPRAPDLLGADGFGDIDLNGNGVPDPNDDLGNNFLSWAPSWDDDLSTGDAFAGYDVYRATAPGGPWTRIRSADARLVQDNSYTDKAAPIGVTAYYRVTAVDTAGNESAPATTEPGEYAATVASALRPDTGLYPPQRPTGLTGVLSGDDVVLDWDDNSVGSPVHGLTDGYQVASASSASGPSTVLAGDTVPLTSSRFTDTTVPLGSTRYFRVRAVGKEIDAGTPRVYSQWTDPVAVTRPIPPDTTPPPAPGAPEVTAPDGGTTATLTWNSIGWPGYVTDFAGYQVTRSDSPDGPFDDAGSPRRPQCAAVTGTEQVRCTLTDGPIAADATPYYRVVSVDQTGNRSSGTVVQLRRLSTPVPKPSTPTGLTATRVDGGILLDWNDSPASEVYLYYLYRTTYGSACVNADTFHTAESQYLDTNPMPTARYCLSVRGFQGEYSDQVWIDVSDEPAPAPQTPEMPTVQGGADGVRVTWSGNDPVAAKYEIWRRTETDTAYTKIAEIPAATSLDWTDTDAPAGVPACYQTVAVNAEGARSGFSEDGCALRPYPEGTVRPDRPTGLAERQDGDHVAVLSWQPVPGATGYLVYRYWGNAASPGTLVQREPVTGTTVTDTDAPFTSSNASYAIVAVDAAGVRSEAAVLPWVGDGYGASMTLAASGSADGVRLTWNWFCQGEWCPPLSSFTVERWNRDSQTWEELSSTVPGTETSYLDSTAPAGETSYYMVQAYGQDGPEPSQMGFGAVPGTRPAAPAPN